ncbi:hypothetical protein KIPB_013169, partial [Kipferlia bialata]
VTDTSYITDNLKFYVLHLGNPVLTLIESVFILATMIRARKITKAMKARPNLHTD